MLSKSKIYSVAFFVACWILCISFLYFFYRNESYFEALFFSIILVILIVVSIAEKFPSKKDSLINKGTVLKSYNSEDENPYNYSCSSDCSADCGCDCSGFCDHWHGG